MTGAQFVMTHGEIKMLLWFVDREGISVGLLSLLLEIQPN